MKWKTKVARLGDTKVKRRFSILKRVLDDGFTIRMQWYYEIWRFETFEVFALNKHRIQVTDWRVIQTVSVAPVAYVKPTWLTTTRKFDIATWLAIASSVCAIYFFAGVQIALATNWVAPGVAIASVMYDKLFGAAILMLALTGVDVIQWYITHSENVTATSQLMHQMIAQEIEKNDAVVHQKLTEKVKEANQDEETREQSDVQQPGVQ